MKCWCAETRICSLKHFLGFLLSRVILLLMKMEAVFVAAFPCMKRRRSAYNYPSSAAIASISTKITACTLLVRTAQ
jgi:hypothetical protein